MGFHTFDPERAARLEDESRFRYCSREELLEPLQSAAAATILDIGSGTGFYADELAPFVDILVALDLQPAMHDLYRDNGVPENVRLVTADAGAVPVGDDHLDGAVSTMTFHESTTPESLADLHRVLRPEAPYVVVDWSSEGQGDSGPPRDERYDATQARSLLEDAGFAVEIAAERSETFRIVAFAMR